MGIAKSTASAIYQMAGKRNVDVCYELDRLQMTRQSLYQYMHGRYTPSAHLLQRMALAGYDVVWILTGGKQ